MKRLEMVGEGRALVGEPGENPFVALVDHPLRDRRAQAGRRSARSIAFRRRRRGSRRFRHNCAPARRPAAGRVRACRPPSAARLGRPVSAWTSPRDRDRAQARRDAITAIRNRPAVTSTKIRLCFEQDRQQRAARRAPTTSRRRPAARAGRRRWPAAPARMPGTSQDRSAVPAAMFRLPEYG